MGGSSLPSPCGSKDLDSSLSGLVSGAYNGWVGLPAWCWLHSFQSGICKLSVITSVLIFDDQWAWVSCPPGMLLLPSLGFCLEQSSIQTVHCAQPSLPLLHVLAQEELGVSRRCAPALSVPRVSMPSVWHNNVVMCIYILASFAQVSENRALTSCLCHSSCTPSTENSSCSGMLRVFVSLAVSCFATFHHQKISMIIRNNYPYWY